MTEERFARTELLLGKEGMQALAEARVAVFGIGGVGGHAAEALARSGVGSLDLIDKDVVSLSNINRQIIALESTLGRNKAEVMRERIAQINPEARVLVHDVFYLPETAGEFDFREYDYVVDAIDTVKGKVALVMQAKEAGTPIISAMGAGNKLDASAFSVADIYDTSVCPLARVMRRELRSRGIDSLKVVYSREEPAAPMYRDGDAERVCGKQVPGSCAFAPSVAGLIMAGEVVRDLVKPPLK